MQSRNDVVSNSDIIFIIFNEINNYVFLKELADLNSCNKLIATVSTSEMSVSLADICGVSINNYFINIDLASFKFFLSNLPSF